MPLNNESRINAAPAKEFFISMLVRDIHLLEAIPDLIDNCCDGARRARGDDSDSFQGFSVQIELTSDLFRIRDNCGGISVIDAREKVFRFGRDSGMIHLPSAIGLFGVGMKRALFKMGNHFHMASCSTQTRFVVEVDVSEWKNRPEWEFAFQSAESDLIPVPLPKCGTAITVTQLHPSVTNTFGSELFRDQLAEKIQEDHRLYLLNGLEINLNGRRLVAQPIHLRQSDRVQAASQEFEIAGKKPVRVRLVAGLGDSNPPLAGWNIFCNGRQVLHADQTLDTGWGEREGIKIPKFHNQFSEFRGFAFMDCGDAAALPWNTTKAGIDRNSAVYNQVRQYMMFMMRTVIDFLNVKDKEKDQVERPLHDAVLQSPLVGLAEIGSNESFIFR